jgi:hypothetical protein
MTTLRIAFGALALAASLVTFAGESSAQVATAEQRAACTPDAFRLCASEIPNLHAQEQGEPEFCLQGRVRQVNTSA